MIKGLSVIVFHNSTVSVQSFTEEEHNAEVERVRKLPGTLYALDYWSPQWRKQ